MTVDDLKFRVGSNIRRIRENKDMPQQDLAAICNFDKSTMSRIEAGIKNLTLATLHKVSAALEVPVRDLFDNC